MSIVRFQTKKDVIPTEMRRAFLHHCDSKQKQVTVEETGFAIEICGAIVRFDIEVSEVCIAGKGDSIRNAVEYLGGKAHFDQYLATVTDSDEILLGCTTIPEPSHTLWSKPVIEKTLEIVRRLTPNEEANYRCTGKIVRNEARKEQIASLERELRKYTYPYRHPDYFLKASASEEPKADSIEKIQNYFGGKNGNHAS